MNLFGQKLITDTLVIDFRPDSLVPCNNYHINNIIDNRSENPELVSYTTRQKFLLIPVDMELTTKNPLAEEIMPKHFEKECEGRELSLKIEHFEIIPVKKRVSINYQLNADIQVYSDTISDSSYLGTLIYNDDYNPPGKQKSKKEITEAMMKKWHTDFKIDLLRVANYHPGDSIQLDNFLTNKYKKPYFLYATVASMAGFDFWQLEGELNISRPEAHSSIFRQSGIIRYTNTKDFETISFGKKTAHQFYRLNDRMGIDANLNILIGINRWKKVDEQKVKLEHLLNFSVSSVQSLSFEKKNKSGLLLKAGIYENVYYIIEKKVKFQFGLYGCLGYKF